MLSVTVNGERLSFEEEPTIQEILERLKAPGGAVAVEVNRVIVPKQSHARRRLRDGDDIEVVTFVGGG
jgi:sulfur carrier protein